MSNKRYLLDWVIVAVLFFIGFKANTQIIDGASDEQLEHCATISKKSQNELLKIDIENIDSLVSVLNEWEASCYYSEPIQRMYMLMDIGLGVYDPEKYPSFYSRYYYDVVNRFSQKEDSIAVREYEWDSLYYGYVPIGGDYDQYTMKIAREILPFTQEGTDAHLVCLLYSGSVDEVEQKLYAKDYSSTYMVKERYAQGDGIKNVEILLGAWMPMGILSDDFNMSPQIGVGWSIYLSPTWFLEAQGKVAILIDNEKLNIREEDIITEKRPSTNIYIGIHGGQRKAISKEYYREFKAGVGLAVLTTGVEKIYTEEAETINIETFDINAGGGIYKNLGKDRNIGLYGMLHLSPFNIDKALQNSIGNVSLDLGIGFRF